jgi:NADPH:quinone reductase-like Zn-dependent oxidoreductase
MMMGPSPITSSVGAPEALWHPPDGIGDEVASTLPVAGLTAAAAVAAIDLRAGDTVLVGGAAGGVGVFAVQLAKLAGARVIGTALAVGVPSERISTIAARPNPPGGVHATGAIDARPDAMERITEAIIAGKITVPIAATFPIEQIRDAVRRQAGRHVHGKIVITLRRRLR